MAKRPFFTNRQRITQPLELLHLEVCGSFIVQARGGCKYYVTFIDDYYRNGLTKWLENFETFRKFKEFHTEVEK